MSNNSTHTTGQEDWRPARETKAQREWQPGQKRAPRSIRKMFTVTVLGGEAFTLFFYGIMLFNLNRDQDIGLWLLIGSWVLMVIAIAAIPLIDKKLGVILGWIASAGMIVGGFFEISAFLVGIGFTAAYAYALIRGKQIDEENAQRALEQERWEAENLD